ncbi:MAG: hypothetical protein VYA30_01300 [Myxococcota bacterium]|nr:hypothetical protein [Myxococcota bacterium]
MTKLNQRPCLVAVLMILICACDEQVPSVKLALEPDARTSIETDATVDPDAQIVDAAPVVDARVIADATPFDSSLPDYVVDVPPDQHPRTNEYVVLGGGDETIVAWWRGGRLFVKHFTATIAPVNEGGVPPAGPIDPTRVQLIENESQEIGFYPPFEGQIKGHRPPNQSDGHPGWIFLPGEREQGWLGIDLTSVNHDAIELGIFGDIQLGSRSAGATDSDQVIVLGQPTQDETRNIAMVVLSDALTSVPRIDARNRPRPVDITTSGTHWIFAYEDGICALIQGTSTGPDEELGTWRCGTAPNTRLIGRGPINLDDPGVYGVGQTAEEVLAWDLRPGERIYPVGLTAEFAEPQPDPPNENQITDAGDMGSDPSDAGVNDGSNNDAHLDGEVSSDAMNTAPDSGEAELDGGDESDASNQPPLVQSGQMTLVETSSALAWTNPIPNGKTATVSHGQALLFEQGQIRFVDGLEQPRLGLISATGGAIFSLVWDEIRGEPVAVRDTLIQTAPVPKAAESVCPSRSPEACDHTDRDCDGYSYGHLCCHFSFAFDDITLPASESLEGPWFVRLGDEGPLATVGYDGRVELHTLSQGRNDCLGCWPGGHSITGFSGDGAVFVISAETQLSDENNMVGCSPACTVAEPWSNDMISEPADGLDSGVDAGINSDATVNSDSGVDASSDLGLADAGHSDGSTAVDGGNAQDASSKVLFWHLRPGVVRTTAAPCERVYHMETYGEADGTSTHIYCANRRFDYRVSDGEFIGEPAEVAYPFGATHWLSPPVKRREGGNDVTYLMAATGDDHALHLLRITRAGWSVVETPELNMAITVADRRLPFRPSISDQMRPARIIDGKSLEVHFARLGWRQAVSRKWVRSVAFSAHDNLAIAVTEDLDPTAPDFDDIQQTLNIQAHDLSTEGNHWGRLLNVRSTAILSHSFHGVSIADFSERENERAIWMGLGRNRSPVVLSGFGVRCRDATDF